MSRICLLFYKFYKRSPQIAAVALLAVSLSQAQEPQPAITLLKSAKAQSLAKASLASPAPEVNSVQNSARVNFRQFTQSKVGSPATPELFTLEFHAPSSVKVISATQDFRVSGGTCKEGHTYLAGESCNVEVTLTPKSAGLRTGQLSVVHTASATPFLVPLGGTAFGPTVSFIPGLMGTVPGTYTGSGASAGGIFLNPQGIAVDGGDNLYVADTGNNLIKFRDSSGVFTSLVGGGTGSAVGYSGFGAGIKLNAPRGVAVDYSGTFYISDTGDSVVLVRYIDGIINTRIGGGATGSSCSFASPCLPYNVKITPPYGIATDASGNVYTTLQVGGSLPGFYLAENEADNNNYYLLNTTAYNYYSTSPSLAVDAYQNLLYTYEDPGGPLLSPTPLCYILGQNRAYSTSAPGQRFWTVAGSGPCGFSGDGGRATGAEISKNIGQFAFDAAGNFYFADTGNNRIRRVDAVNGIIRTVAGNGATGFGGDGGPSTLARIQAPVGLAVDSNGQIYATGSGASSADSTSLKADIRMFGTIGSVSFGNQATSTPSAAQSVLISNVGNDTLNFTHAGFSSGNTSDFVVDANTTTCNFTLPLYSGHSCSVGFIFTPSVVGNRSAVYSVLDDTLAGINTIQITGTGSQAAVVSPTSHDFSPRTVGGASGPMVFTLSNTGTATLNLNSYTFTGANPSDFTQTHTCLATLAAGANCTISVIYKPLAAGSRSATLTIATSANSLAIALTGTATAPAIVKPKVTLSSVANPAPSGRAIVLASQVADDTGASRALAVGHNPTGQVQIMDGTRVLATATLTASGAVTFRLPNLRPGIHMLTANYLGDAQHSASSSDAVRQVVRVHNARELLFGQ